MRVTVAAGAAISEHVPHEAAKAAVVLDLNAASDLPSEEGRGLELVCVRIFELVGRKERSRLPEGSLREKVAG